MAQKKPVIPWESDKAWAQVVMSMSKTISALSAHPDGGSETAKIRRLSKQIVQAYADIEPILQRVCLASCPTCVDVCCRRATVWYDLKDLLIIFLNTGGFPDKQIYRRPDDSCCNLTPSGCGLKRTERPFICTWYICPDQKNVIEGLRDCAEGSALFRAIDEIKIARKVLEREYGKALWG